MATGYHEVLESGTWEWSVGLLCALPNLRHDERVAAVTLLLRSSSETIRKRALRLGAELLPEEMLAEWLRESADDVTRNAGLEVLKLRGSRSFTLVRGLASDPDPDVVLQSALLLDHYRDPRGVPVLRGLLAHPDTNVVQAAILGLGHHRDPSVISDLAPFLAADPWLQIATIQALGDLGDASALRVLEPLLDDEFLESFVAEAIAQIGGARALRVISKHWITVRNQTDAERYLSLLASVAVQLPRHICLDMETIAAVQAYLSSGSDPLKTAAAKVILALGPLPVERAALQILANGEDVSGELPSSLSQRRDLIPVLLARCGPPREWGLQLAARYPLSTNAAAIAAATGRGEVPVHLREAAVALSKQTCPDAASAVIQTFVMLPVERRAEIEVAVNRHSKGILEALCQRGDLSEADRVVLFALAGENKKLVADRIVRLGDGDRRVVIPQIFLRQDVIRELPWAEWVRVDAPSYGALLADAIMDANFTEGAPILQSIAREALSSGVVDALACNVDTKTLDLFEEILGGPDGPIKATVWNALGRIGGAGAAGIFRRIAPTLPPTEGKFAFRAWAACATSDDSPIFRGLASHPDWVVRSAAAEVLARFPDEANAAALSMLALDPVDAVAAKARAISIR